MKGKVESDDGIRKGEDDIRKWGEMAEGSGERWQKEVGRDGIWKWGEMSEGSGGRWQKKVGGDGIKKGRDGKRKGGEMA